MSDVNIEVGKTISLSLDYDEYNLDEDQALLLWELLGEQLGKTAGGK